MRNDREAERSNHIASRPKVVALVPAWRSAAFVQETLDSLAAQTYPNFEILISDDASPDNTAQICEAFAAPRTNVRVIRQPKNLGWIANVNTLLREASGDYFFFAFHDDVLDSKYVERLAAALEAHPRAVVSFSDMSTQELNGSIERQVYSHLEGVSSPYLRGRFIASREGDWWTPNRGLFRASAAREIGGLRRNLAGEFSADLPWLLRLVLIGEFVRVPEVLVMKRMTGQSVSKRWQFSDWQRCALLLSCLGAVRESPLPLMEKLRLQTFMIWHNLGRMGGRVARRFSRVSGGPSREAQVS